MALQPDAKITFVVPPPNQLGRATTMTVIRGESAGIRLLTPPEEAAFDEMVSGLLRCGQLHSL
jgi:hypothetical protein